MAEKNITGKVEVGDEVRTLHLKRAIHGHVLRIVKHKRVDWATVLGYHYDGGPQVTCTADVENLAITRKNIEKLFYA